VTIPDVRTNGYDKELRLNRVLPRSEVFSGSGVYAWVDNPVVTESPINGASIHHLYC